MPVQELSTAVNIKDKRNRLNVVEALKSIQALLLSTGRRETPSTGMCMFAGHCI